MGQLASMMGVGPAGDVCEHYAQARGRACRGPIRGQGPTLPGTMMGTCMGSAAPAHVLWAYRSVSHYGIKLTGRAAGFFRQGLAFLARAFRTPTGTRVSRAPGFLHTPIPQTRRTEPVVIHRARRALSTTTSSRRPGLHAISGPSRHQPTSHTIERAGGYLRAPHEGEST